MDMKFLESEFKEFVENTLALWHVPGLAVAVIKDGQVILCEGFGLRNVTQALPVTSETLFPIASCTKAFTAMSVALLVEAGQLAWDKPVKEYLPTFRLWDSFATERLTPRDLLTHRSGLPGHDMMWYASNFSRREIFDRLRYLEPSCDLRTTFQYNNIMVMVAGMLVEEVAGTSWEQFVQTRIFDRVGMTHSNFSTEVTQQVADFATPYLYRDNQLKEIPFLKQDGENCSTGPAGNICSCASDMAKWLQLHLNRGKIGEESFISEANLAQMYTPQIFVDDPLAKKWYGGEFPSYGLGWGVRSHKGHVLVEHDGMTDGFYALTSMLPQAKIGIVALSNSDAYYNPVQSNLVPNIVAYTLYDRLLGLEPTDWQGRMKAVYDELLDATELNQESPSAEPVPPSHPIESYLGDYEHRSYGVVSIRKVGEQLQMVINDKLILPLEHWRYDIFEVIYEIVNQRQKISFYTDLQGDIAQVAIKMEPKVADIIFARVPN
jgi:CubicO group peptidase (beta-lactamase class C family)